MDIVDKINDIVALLEDSVSYEDLKLVEEAIKELNFLIEELDSDFPLDQYEDEY